MKFGLNRLDLRGPVEFAESARRAEAAGWSLGVIPCSPLLASDPYVNLAFAAQATETLELGTLLDTPILRHPSVLAGSIATVAGLAPGRVQLGIGVGDTAVRLNGLAPAKVATLEAACRKIRALLAGEGVEVGAARPAVLRHARPVPLWVAAQGPRTLRMAGAVADGVWIRLGRHPDNLRMAWDAVAAGARDAGRDPAEVRLGLIFHTAYETDPARALLLAKSLAAGYYEYSPFLFDRPGIAWEGEDVHELRKQAWPDFHHHRDLVHAGTLVDFLPRAAADAFALYGDWEQIADQLREVLDLGLPVEYVIPHPVMAPDRQLDYIADAGRELVRRFA